MICEYGDWLAVHIEVKIFAAPHYGKRLTFRLAISLFRGGEESAGICNYLPFIGVGV